MDTLADVGASELANALVTEANLVSDAHLHRFIADLHAHSYVSASALQVLSSLISTFPRYDAAVFI